MSVTAKIRFGKENKMYILFMRKNNESTDFQKHHFMEIDKVITF